MTVTIDKDALADGVEGNVEELMEEAMRRWFSASQDWLEQATSQRAGGGGADDSEGRHSRRGTGLFAIQQSGQILGKEGDEYVFVYTHPAAIYHEFGTRPHEITAKDGETLAFEWPDAPPEVQEMFAGTFPLVFFKEVLHPGTPAIAFVRRGREEAVEFLEGRGMSVEGFEPQEAELNAGARRWIEERGLS